MTDINSSSLPVLPVRNTVMFPGISVSLYIGRPKSAAAIKRANEFENMVLVVAQRDGEVADPSSDDLYRVGTLCKVETIRKSDKGLHVLATGIARFKITGITDNGDLIQARGHQWDDTIDVNDETQAALAKSLKDLAIEILELLPAETGHLVKLINNISDGSLLSHLIAGNLEASVARKQELLENISFKDRALALLTLMQEQKDSLQVQNQIREKMSQRLGKAQREVLLREQLNTIREELGESSGQKTTDDYRARIDEANMPEEAQRVALEELKRLETIGNTSPEAHVIRNYLDLLVSMPWSKAAQTQIDLDAAQKILDEEHYGLEKIKQRIIEHLAVMKLRKAEGKGSILLFVGPPGVGKTSLGQSIAKALGRKFVRASLGGVRDDAEIRGHRRTYIGAMPGRVVQGIKRAGEKNPVFMLDEVDKLSRSFQGDPASALLEVLDPEQNATFLDHYLDVPFDLSQVFFIATANTLETIPGPLLDRMEVINLAGYTTAEKLHIAKTHLIPKQLQEHGMTPSELMISDEALEEVITRYTREAGVREVQRRIAAICRGSARKVLERRNGQPLTIHREDLEEILGPPKYISETAESSNPPGVSTGLAWTPQGGEILFMEATRMPGTGRLIITGQLGEVMKESAQIALSLVRSRLPQLNSSQESEKQDVHLHVPAGAIPKDGPSAGLAMMMAIASLYAGKSVDPQMAMTGEVTLRGAVMPVGGIKEKVLAAHRAGIRQVILPKRNEVDVKEVPEDVKKELQFHFVSNASEVLKLALDLETVAPVNPKPSVTENKSHPRQLQ